MLWKATESPTWIFFCGHYGHAWALIMAVGDKAVGGCVILAVSRVVIAMLFQNPISLLLF